MGLLMQWISGVHVTSVLHHNNALMILHHMHRCFSHGSFFRAARLVDWEHTHWQFPRFGACPNLALVVFACSAMLSIYPCIDLCRGATVMGVFNILMFSCLSICQVTLAQEEKHHIQLHKIPYGKSLNLWDIGLSTYSSIIYAMAESEWSIIRCKNLAFCFKHPWIIPIDNL